MDHPSNYLFVYFFLRGNEHSLMDLTHIVNSNLLEKKM